MKKIVFIFCLFIFSGVLWAQQSNFKVLAASGTVQVKSGTDSWTKAQAGKRVGNTDVIKIAEGSLVGLLYKNGTTLEIKVAGVYSYAELEKLLSEKAKTTITGKYAEYVMNEVSKANDEPVKVAPGKHMNITGAVMRSAPGVKAPVIKLYVPPTDILANSNPTLHWSRAKEEGAYVIRVMNMENDVLMVKDSDDTSATLELSSIPTLKNEKMALVTIELKANKMMRSALVPLNLVSGPDAIELDKQLTGIKDNLNKKNATDWIGLALFCEQNSLNLDAYDAYLNALRLAPKVADYQTMYNDFLTRVKFKEVLAAR